MLNEQRFSSDNEEIPADSNESASKDGKRPLNNTARFRKASNVPVPVIEEEKLEGSIKSLG